jgi:acetyl esterase/lipase
MKSSSLIIVAIFVILAGVFLEPYFMAPQGTSYRFSFYIASTIFKTMYKFSYRFNKIPQFRELCMRRQLELVKFDDPDIQIFNNALQYDHNSPLYYDLEKNESVVKDILIRTVVPKELITDGKKLPVFVYFHGGGWHMNSIDSYHEMIKSIARVGFIVVAVNYRKAPENPFPDPFNDCLQSIVWAYENAEKYGGDLSKMVIGGDSAGGNIAIAASLFLNDHQQYKDLKVCYQVLIYPAVFYPWQNPTLFETYRTYSRYGYIVDTDMLFTMWKMYAGKYHDQANELKYLAPFNSMEQEDYSKLPPSMFILAEHDPLRSEGEVFANNMQESGVSVSCKTIPATFHGFATLENTAVVENLKTIVLPYLNSIEADTGLAQSEFRKTE